MRKKWISLFAALCLCLNVLSPLAGAVGEGVDFVLTNLQTEYRTDPIGLDVASGVLERDFLPLKNPTESDLETIKALQAIVDVVEKDQWVGGDIWY
ncbi:MAG TPA: hypothetical protein DCE08_02660 [Ruminococcaceae bacterium]|nr:hypothetical protein [Oscillospiraceae bacterium]